MNLRQAVESIVSDAPSALATKSLAELFHRLAIVYLRKKARTGRLKPDLFGIPLEDMAFDCIADLFNRSDQGVFVELQKYYSSLEYQGMNEDDLLGISRRLVFSKVTQDLFRQYHELDPTLHRIIRNIKDAVQQVPNVCAKRKNDEWWLSYGKNDERTVLPVLAPEILEAYLSSVISGGMTVKEILIAVGGIFADQPQYQNAYPLFGLACIIRSTYARLGEIHGDKIEDAKGIGAEEIDRQIAASVSAVSTSMRKTYLEKGKLDETTFTSYFSAVANILRVEFIEQDHEDGSYFNHLSKEISGLTPESYRATHRVYVEYLTKITRKHFMDEMKKEL